MAFDPTKPFEVVTAQSQAVAPAFDPSKPFERADRPGLSDEEFNRLIPPTPKPDKMELTTAGGPQLRQAGAPGAGAELGRELGEAATEPAVALPKFTINKDDSKTMAVGKEAANLIIGIPEFTETPAGIATLPMGALAPKAVAAGFGAFTLHNLGTTVLATHRNWAQYSPAQRAAAVTDIAGNIALAGVLAKTALGKPQIQDSEAVTPQPSDIAGKPEGKNMPDWTKEEMLRRGLDPKRPLNDIDIQSPSVIDAVKSDPTLSEKQKENILTTGSPKSLELVENLEILRQVMEDEHRFAAAREISAERDAEKQGKTPQAPQTTSKRPTLGSRPDGIPDILDAINEEGGIKPPGETAGGEYDGYKDAMTGAARLLRNTSSRHTPDTMIQALQNRGYEGIETPDHLWEAIRQASEERKNLPERMKQEATAAKAEAENFERFTKSLAQQGNAVWSGGVKLADLKTDKTGRTLFIPTQAGHDLPTEYQEHVVEKFFKAEKTPSTDKGEEENAAPEAKGDVNEKPSGFKPPQMPEKFNTLEEVLKYRNDYKDAEISFYKSLGMSDTEATKFFRAADNRSNLDVSKIEDKLTPENRARLDEFSTGEGSEMYQWDRQYNPEDLLHENDKAELARHVVQNLVRESTPNEFGDKMLHATVALRKLKDAGGTWSDIARQLDQYTTRNSGSQGDKAELFKDHAQKIQGFAKQQGVSFEQGDLAKSTETQTKFGVPTAQWDEMANYNDYDQMKRWGTTRATLMKDFVIKDMQQKGKLNLPAGKLAAKSQIDDLRGKIAEQEKVLSRLTNPLARRPTEQLLTTYRNELGRLQGGNRVEGMGGGRVPTPAKSPARVAAETSGKVMRERTQTPERTAGGELATALDKELSPNNPAKRFPNLRMALNPASLGESGKIVADTLRYVLGKQFVNEQRFDAAMAKYRAMFDRATTPRGYKYDANSPLPANWETQRAIDTGDVETLTPAERDFAALMRKMFDQTIEEIQKFKPDVLQDLYENYFPRSWVKVDGTPADAEALRLARAHRPWEGPKTFLKPRSLALWDDALKLGLKPRYDNPADAAYAKLAEMWRFAGALEAHTILKERGVRRFRYIFEQAPEGWTPAAPNDPSTKVFAPPTVTVQEAYDTQIRQRTLEMLQALGIPHERLTKMGAKKWGLAYEAGQRIETKFGGPDFVFWHEFGHIMDFRYPDLRKALGLDNEIVTKDGKHIWRGSGIEDKELRALADARLPEGDTGERFYVSRKTGKTMKGRSSFGSYVRKTEEKMANVFDAYLRAPELFRQKAPNVFSKLLRWLEKHPEVKGPLNNIRPSLRLGSGTAQKFVGGPVLLGEWIMPEAAARVMQNHLDPGIWGKAKTLSAIKKLGGIMSNVRLISLFHGQMVSNDALASGLSLPLYDAMNAVAKRNPKLLSRAGHDILLAPVRPFIALYQGSKMLKAIRGGEAPELEKQLAQYSTEANLRAGHMDHIDNASRRWKQALAETANAVKAGQPEHALGPAWSAFLQTPMMISHEMMRPVMEWFVPRMKYGLAAPMLMRIVRDNPEADEWTLRRQFGKAADSVEDRVGQVTYDNMFMSRAVKDSAQLALQAFGWHATKERMLWGGASDYFKAGAAMLQGKQPDITFRMAYLPAMVVTHAIIGGMIMYSLTGRRPKTALDYLFPETGLVDQYGKPVRVALADFMKDYLSEYDALAHGPKAEIQLWERRLMPVWNELADMYRNRDFWNTQIFSDRKFAEPEWQHLWDNLKEGLNYVVTGNQPFSVRGAEKFSESLPSNPTLRQEALAKIGPFFGFVPAPSALTQTPAEARAGEIMRNSLPAMTKDQEQRAILTSQLVHDIRTGKLNDEGQLMARARAAGIDEHTPEGKRKLTEIKERVAWTPLQYQIYKLPLSEPGGGDAMSVWDLMSETEKRETAPIYRVKLQAAFKGKRMDRDTVVKLLRVILPYMRQPAQPPQASAPASTLAKY